MALIEPKFEELRSEGRRVVAYRSDWGRVVGVIVNIWLCQALFTQSRAGAGRWWFKKLLADRDQEGGMRPPESETDQSFEYETGLTRSQQESARAMLRELGILLERKSTWPRRLEYMLNLDRLCELSKEWGHDEGNLPRSGKQESALLKAEPSGQESEIQRSSTKSIEILKEKSRTKPGANGNQRSAECQKVESRSHDIIVKPKKRTTEPGGIRCWTDKDRERAKALLEEFGEGNVQAAVLQVEGNGAIPFPSAVTKVLSHSRVRTLVQETSERMSAYYGNENENERKMFAVARATAQALSTSERAKLLPIFIEELGPSHKTTLDTLTGAFGNSAEGLQFERWLEKRFADGVPPPCT